MPPNISRLRKWFAAAAIALAMVVAGFYFYGRLRLERALDRLPQRLGVDVQQSTQGFTFSRSEKGHTLFTVHASKAVQYKQGGRAELRDVSIIVYGARANRYDQIYGDNFEYDPQSGNITAQGEVHIDLEGNAEGPLSPDQAQPQELKNPIHLKTSGLVFNQKSGLAETREAIEFRVPQAEGHAQGAIYDSRAGTLTLVSDVRVRSAAPQEEDISARHGVISKAPNRVVLDQVSLKRPATSFQTRQLTLFFREDNTVERMKAEGDVQAEARGRSNLNVTSPQAEVFLSGHNQVRTAVLSGGVAWDASGQNNMSGRAGQLEMEFSAGNQLQKVTTSQNASLTERPQGAAGSEPGQTVEVTASAIDFLVPDGRRLEKAVTSGPAQVVVSNAQAAGVERTVATAGQFVASFDAQNRLRNVVGEPAVKVVDSPAGQPVRTSTSGRLQLELLPEGGIASLDQQGNLHYEESAAPGARPSQTGRSAWADSGRYTPVDQKLVLTGSPRIVDGGMTTTAQRLILDRRSGEALADGDVKTTYSELRPAPGGGMFAGSDPIHVTAPQMRAQQGSGTAVYSGGARLWQGANVVEAPVIEFDRDQRTVAARAEAGGPSASTAKRVSTIFVQRDQQGKATPIMVSARSLTYSGTAREASFQGEVVAQGSEATITARQMDVYMQSNAQKQGGAPSPAAAPSELERVVARGKVIIEQGQRRARGEVLTYVVDKGEFRLTGGTPSIFDAEHGQTTGDSLTFYSRDDRVVVESKGKSPTVTRTRVAK